MLDALRDQKSKLKQCIEFHNSNPYFWVRYNITFLEPEWKCCDLGALASVVKFMETECIFVFLRRDFYEGE